MSGQIQKISVKFTMGDMDFVFKIADGQATLALPAKDVRIELTTAEWLTVADTVYKLLDGTPRRSNARGPNVGALWTAKMDTELLHRWDKEHASIADIAVAMGRTEYGIALRLVRHLDLDLSAIYAENENRGGKNQGTEHQETRTELSSRVADNSRGPNYRARWTANMDAELLRRWNDEHTSLADIAVVMGRSEHGIASRLVKNLGIELHAIYTENRNRGARTKISPRDADDTCRPDVGTPWDPKMDAALRYHWGDRRESLDRIAVLMDRSEYDVALRLTQLLGINLTMLCTENLNRKKHPSRPNEGAPWTSEMDAELLHQWDDERVPIEVIGLVMGRSIQSISLRLYHNLRIQRSSLIAENKIRFTERFDDYTAKPDKLTARPDVDVSWTPTMDGMLLHQWTDKRASLDCVAIVLGRPESDVALRLTQLLGIELTALYTENEIRNNASSTKV